MSHNTDKAVSPIDKTSFVEIIETILDRPEVDRELASRLEAVTEYLRIPDDESRPFLSVLLRTQGKRIEPLKDAMLCLAAQTLEDFELIVLEHNALPEDVDGVREVIDRQPPAFRSRIRHLVVEGGTRAKPLNEGIAAARGHYIAVYDDDDLIFANWVEEFRAAAHRGDGRLLRSTVATQSITPEIWPDGSSGFRTGSWPAAEYPVQFHQLEHLLVNYSPFMSWAFPRSLFFTFGLRFDEELEVCEDWDMILRGSLLCGVEEIESLTAIYRRWEGGSSSYTIHNTGAWQKSEKRVLDRIDSSTLTLPPGSVERIRELIGFHERMKHFEPIFRGPYLWFPLRVTMKFAGPVAHFAVRVRNRLRRSLAKAR